MTSDNSQQEKRIGELKATRTKIKLQDKAMFLRGLFLLADPINIASAGYKMPKCKLVAKFYFSGSPSVDHIILSHTINLYAPNMKTISG